MEEMMCHRNNRRFVYSVVTAVTLVLVAWSAIPTAQTPAGSPPPTYGQTILSTYNARFIRQSQLIFTLIVPSGDLQNVVPPGYTVLPGDTATISVNFGLQQREELPRSIGTLSKGTYGPASLMIVQAEVIDPDGHYEQLLLDNERSTDDSVSFVNGLFGEGSARKPSPLTIKMEELAQEQGEEEADDGTINDRIIRFSGRVENEGFGLMLGVQATVPAAITTAVRNSLNRGPDGLPERFRFINGTAHPPVPNTAILQVINDDRVTIPSAGHLRVELPSQELRLPEGTLHILRVGPTVTLLRNRENFQLICSGIVCP
jgi:hypothetical protein